VTLYKSKENINVVQPDIIVMCDTNKVDSKGKYKGVPTLVVEVLSPSTRTKDMNKKFELFRMTGVLEYWMVDVEKKTIYVYRFEENSVVDYKVFANVDTAESSVFDGLKVSLQEVFID
jgi:Uma2 family endonuclease